MTTPSEPTSAAPQPGVPAVPAATGATSVTAKTTHAGSGGAGGGAAPAAGKPDDPSHRDVPGYIGDAAEADPAPEPSGEPAPPIVLGRRFNTVRPDPTTEQPLQWRSPGFTDGGPWCVLVGQVPDGPAEGGFLVRDNRTTTGPYSPSPKPNGSPSSKTSKPSAARARPAGQRGAARGRRRDVGLLFGRGLGAWCGGRE